MPDQHGPAFRMSLSEAGSALKSTCEAVSLPDGLRRGGHMGRGGERCSLSAPELHMDTIQSPAGWRPVLNLLPPLNSLHGNAFSQRGPPNLLQVPWVFGCVCWLVFITSRAKTNSSWRDDSMAGGRLSTAACHQRRQGWHPPRQHRGDGAERHPRPPGGRGPAPPRPPALGSLRCHTWPSPASTHSQHVGQGPKEAWLSSANRNCRSLSE